MEANLPYSVEGAVHVVFYSRPLNNSSPITIHLMREKGLESPFGHFWVPYHDLDPHYNYSAARAIYMQATKENPLNDLDDYTDLILKRDRVFRTSLDIVNNAYCVLRLNEGKIFFVEMTRNKVVEEE